MSLTMQSALVESLRKAVKKCDLANVSTEWGDYYSDTNYSDSAMTDKQDTVKRLLGKCVERGHGVVHDLGANTGRFSRIAAEMGFYVLSHDIDEMAVEKNYRASSKEGSNNLLPLVLDLTNPSPSLGWALLERESSLERISGNCVLALALIHHLAISNNVPILRLAQFFASIAESLIIEFVPKEDSQVKRLLATRVDIFESYEINHFESCFTEYFEIQERCNVAGSERTLFLMTRKH